MAKIWSNWMILIWKACSLIIISRNFVHNHSEMLKKIKSIFKSSLKMFSIKLLRFEVKFSISTILQIAEKIWFHLNSYWSWLCLFFFIDFHRVLNFFCCFSILFRNFRLVFILIYSVFFFWTIKKFCFFFFFSNSWKCKSTLLRSIKN